MQGVNAAAVHKGFGDAGVKDSDILIFSELIHAKSLFLTANADTLFRRRHRPEQGADDARNAARYARHDRRFLMALGHRFRLPGPDRGLGGKYLLLSRG